MSGIRPSSGIRLSIRVWDLPIRFFHWSIVVLLIVAWVSQLEFWMRLHFYAGYAVLILLLFRLAWGVVGSDTARFRSFLTTPLGGLRHLAQFPRREPDTQIGHNAAGGWMVLILLLLLAAETLSGLFSRDDDVSQGPFAYALSGAGTDTASRIHAICWTLVWIAVVLHVLAILAYWLVKRHNLLRPMITGKKRLPAATKPPRMASTPLAFAILAGAAALVAALVTAFGAAG
jgi:cytochrome b